MNRISPLMTTCFLLAGSLLAACGDSDSPPVMEPPPPPPPPEPVSFTQFVKDQVAATADDTDPEAVDDVEFTFDAEEDPNAFDDLF